MTMMKVLMRPLTQMKAKTSAEELADEFLGRWREWVSIALQWGALDDDDAQDVVSDAMAYMLSRDMPAQGALIRTAIKHRALNRRRHLTNRPWCFVEDLDRRPKAQINPQDVVSDIEGEEFYEEVIALVGEHYDETTVQMVQEMMDRADESKILLSIIKSTGLNENTAFSRLRYVRLYLRSEGYGQV